MNKVGDAVVYEESPGYGCQYEHWHREFQTMAPCGEKVHGRIGKTELCKEHFDYVAGVHGIGERDVRRVKR